VTAIDAVLGSGAPERVRPVHLGSLKSRIGHWRPRPASPLS
jgi:acyl transferase domain-containing protein